MPTIKEVIEESVEKSKTIGEKLAKSLVNNDSDEKKSEKLSKFKDGLSFIKAFNGLKEESIASTKTSLTTEMSQKWQIWYWRRNGRQDNTFDKWEDFLQMKSSFATKEEFWRSYNEENGFEFGLLGSYLNYCVFKGGIKPVWEDSANRSGGRWVMQFKRKSDWKHIIQLNEIWLKVLLAITVNEGPFSEYMDEICGMVLMIRYNVNKIAVWTQNADNTLINLKIGQLLKSSTGFTGRMYYTSHDSSVQKIVVKREQKINFKTPQKF